MQGNAFQRGLLIGAASLVLLFAMTVEVEAQCAKCVQFGCADGRHKAPSGSGTAWAGVHGDCLNGIYCNGIHPTCGPEFASVDKARDEAFDTLLNEAAQGAPHAVFALLSGFTESVEIDPDRSALRAYSLQPDCEGERPVVGFIPLSATQLAAAQNRRVETQLAALFGP